MLLLGPVLGGCGQRGTDDPEGRTTGRLAEGPFPVVVTTPRPDDPRVYQVGQGLLLEEEALARAGHVTFHSDYRGYGAYSRWSTVRIGYAHLAEVRGAATS